MRENHLIFRDFLASTNMKKKTIDTYLFAAHVVGDEHVCKNLNLVHVDDWSQILTHLTTLRFLAFLHMSRIVSLEMEVGSRPRPGRAA